MSTLNVGTLTAAQNLIAWNTVISAGFAEPFYRPMDLAYSKIAKVKMPDDWRQPGMPADAVPAQVSFGFSPPNGKGHQYTGTGRVVRPMTAHNINVSLNIYMDALGVSRKDWTQDIKGLLRKVPRDLRRTADKNPDVLLAALLRNGKTGTDYRGEAFFATSKVCSPEGAISDTFDNLFTSKPLTEVNLAAVCQAMRSYKGPDGLVLGVRPDTLIIPPTLEHDAAVATMLKSIVFSTSGNAAPGQAASTAAQGDSPMATVLKYIKNIVIVPELQDGQSINNTSWYVADCSEGPQGLLYVLGQEAEYQTIMDPNSETVFNNDEYRFGWRKVEGVAYGLPQYMARCDA